MKHIAKCRSVFVLLTVIAFNASGQALTRYHHNTFWGRIAFSDHLGPKSGWEVYIQKRTQNDEADKLNIFKHHQLASYWLLLHYQVSDDLRLSVTPFCYFNTIPLFPPPAGNGGRGIREFRWAVQAEQTQKLKYFNFSNRYAIEYRVRNLQEEEDYISNYRVRYRARIEKRIKKEGRALSLILYDEVFLEFGKAIKASPAIFNQNRLYAGFSQEVMKNVKFNLGYMYLVQLRATGKAIDQSNTLWAILTFENVFTQFRKKNEGVASKQLLGR